MFGIRATCGPWFGICSGSGLPGSGFGFGFRGSGSRCWQQFVRVRGGEHWAAAKNPNIFQLASSGKKKAARLSRINHAKKNEQLFFFYYTMKHFSYMVIE